MAAYAFPGIFVMGCLVYLMESYVIRCPEQAEWNIRAEIRCQNATKYFCLYNYIHYTYEEGCTGPEWDIPGSKRVYSRNFNIAPCRDTRYQPIRFVTNGNSDCIFRKSLCTEEGQTLFYNGTTITDSTCRCDYTQGYAFVTVPRNKCSCSPLEEDCSCYLKKCQGIGYYLSADYECTKHVTMKKVCTLMSENGSEDPHIDMEPTGTSRENDSYVIERTYDVAILVSICLFVMIVITMYIMFQQRLPRCTCLCTEQIPTMWFMFHQRLARCPQQSIKQVLTTCFMFHQTLSRYLQQSTKQALKDEIEWIDTGPSMNTTDQNATSNQSAGNAESKRMNTGLSLDTIDQNGSNHESAGNAESKRMDTGPSLDTIKQNDSKHESAGNAESKRVDTGPSLDTIKQNDSKHESGVSLHKYHIFEE